jgi:hypothetical protein
MGQFALAEPGRYVVSLVAAAVAGGAQYCKITSDSSECSIEFDGQIFTDADLDGIFTAWFQEEGSPRLRELGVGLFGALEIDPKGVTLESWGENQGGRLKLSKDGGPKVEKLTKPPWKDSGNITRIKVGAAKSIFFKPLFKKAEAVNTEEALLSETSAHDPLKLTVNDKLVTAPY